MNLAFWKNKKVLITGHTGFKGSWLALWLTKLGADVIGYSLETPFTPNLFKLTNLSIISNSIEGDIRNKCFLNKIVQETKPDIIFHLAAQSLVRESYNNPIETFETNIMGTINLFESIRKSDSVKACINVTSDKCYENKEQAIGYTEQDPMGGYDPYSCSKGCSELITSSYRRSFLTSQGLASARAGNVIGGGDWSKDRLFPDIVRSITANKTIIIRNPDAIRPWQHVFEPLRGYMLLAQCLYESPETYSQGWNFGPDQTGCVPVKDIISKFFVLWGKDQNWKLDENTTPHEAQNLILDCKLAKNKLDWYSIFNINNALEYTVNWYKAYNENEDMEKYSLAQLNQYETLIKENSCKQKNAASVVQN